MRKTQSLIFVPEDVHFVCRKQTPSSPFMSLQEKIRKDPRKREQLRIEATIARGETIDNVMPARKSENRSAPRESVSQASCVQTGVIKAQKSSSSSALEYIINLTGTDIILDFGTSQKVSKSRLEMQLLKPKVLKHYMAKWEFTDEELESVVIKSLYAKGMIKDGNEDDIRQIKEMVQKREDLEKQDLDQRRQLAEYDRIMNPNKAGDTRSIGGVSVNEVDISVGGGIASGALPGLRPDAAEMLRNAQTAGRQNIQFASESIDVGGDSSSPRILSGEEKEMNSLLSGMPTNMQRQEVVDGPVSQGVVSPLELANMFTMKDYKA